VNGIVPLRGRRADDEHENPAWPGLVDLFAFGMVVMLLLWVQALPEPPKPPGSGPEEVGLGQVQIDLSGVVKPGDVVWDRTSLVLRLVRFKGHEIFFESGKFNLAPTDVESIRTVAQDLRRLFDKYPQVVILVNGSADPMKLFSTVPPRDNIELSALRAAEVSRVLVEEGLQQRLQVVGLGEKGDATGKTAEGLREYRKVFLELKWVEAVAAASQKS
jgi:outer membrane protein OmpA-like peptidoglycan-associated protein